jgi:hypothetical protein
VKRTLQPAKQEIVTFSGGNACWLEVLFAIHDGTPNVSARDIYAYARNDWDPRLDVLRKIVNLTDGDRRKVLGERKRRASVADVLMNSPRKTFSMSTLVATKAAGKGLKASACELVEGLKSELNGIAGEVKVSANAAATGAKMTASATAGVSCSLYSRSPLCRRAQNRLIAIGHLQRENSFFHRH